MVKRGPSSTLFLGRVEGTMGPCPQLPSCRHSQVPTLLCTVLLAP